MNETIPQRIISLAPSLTEILFALEFDCGPTCRTGPRIADMVELLFTTFYGYTKQN